MASMLLPLTHAVHMQGDFGCRAADGEATALIQPALGGSDSKLGRHGAMADLMPTSLLPATLGLFTPAHLQRDGLPVPPAGRLPAVI